MESFVAITRRKNGLMKTQGGNMEEELGSFTKTRSLMLDENTGW